MGREYSHKVEGLMKKIICFVSVIVLVFTIAGSEAFARSKKSKEITAAQKKNVTPQKVKDMIARKRASLENTSWDVQITASTGEKKESDVIVFKDKKFSAQGPSAKGFAPVDYSLNLKDGDSGQAVLETMQYSEKEGTIFWRIEFALDDMSFRGMFSEVYPDQKSQDLYCSGSKILQDKTAQ